VNGHICKGRGVRQLRVAVKLALSSFCEVRTVHVDDGYADRENCGWFDSTPRTVVRLRKTLRKPMVTQFSMSGSSGDSDVDMYRWPICFVLKSKPVLLSTCSVLRMLGAIRRSKMNVHGIFFSRQPRSCIGLVSQTSDTCRPMSMASCSDGQKGRKKARWLVRS
jgi:hypothetical protein